MALKIDYKIVIEYFSLYSSLKDKYLNILNDEQLGSMDEKITKEFVVRDAFCRIDTISGSKDNIEINLGIYKDEATDVLIERNKYHFVPDIGGGSIDFIKQGYQHLKTLEEFKDAIDVGEN